MLIGIYRGTHRRTLVVTLALGIQLVAVPAGASGSGLSPQEQAELLHKEAVRQDIDLGGRGDLQPILREAARRAAKLELGCEATALMELRLDHSGIEVIGGYEAFVQCEDAPSPALAYYFNVNQKYLGTVALAGR